MPREFIIIGLLIMTSIYIIGTGQVKNFGKYWFGKASNVTMEAVDTAKQNIK